MPYESDLIGGRQEIWQPLTRDKGADAITYEDITDAATDIWKGMDRDIESPDPSMGWICFVMSTKRYNNSPMMDRFEDQRRRTSSDDSTIGPSRALVDERLGAKFIGDPQLREDDIIYFWYEGAIKHCMQRRRSYKQMMKLNRVSYNQDRILIPMEIEYNYATDMRHLTGWLKSTTL